MTGELASTVPTIVDALEDNFTAWLDAAGENSVTVHQGEPAEPPLVYVQIGEADGDQAWETLAPFRSETYLVTCWVIVDGGEGQASQRDMKTRAFDLFGVLGEGLREHSRLGLEEQARFKFLDIGVGAFRGQPAPREWGYGYLLRFEVKVEATF